MRALLFAAALSASVKAAAVSAAAQQCRRGNTDDPTSTLQPEDDCEGPAVQSFLIRMIWIRHGLSCANALDDCHTDGANLTSIDPQLARSIDGALRAATPGVSIDWAWGVRPKGWVDARGDVATDCALRVAGLPRQLPDGSERLSGVLGFDGDVVRLHDLYQDPALTTCSTFQSRRAGAALRAFLAAQRWGVDLVASSTLLRAAQTAMHMFPGAHVVQLPFIDERAPAAMTALQLDNAPMTDRAQRARLQDGASSGASGTVDGGLLAKRLLERRRSTYPRGAHDFDKFKAVVANQLLPDLLRARASGAQATIAAMPAAPQRDAVVARALAAARPADLRAGGVGVVLARRGRAGLFTVPRGATAATAAPPGRTLYRQGPAIGRAEAAALEKAGTPVLNFAVVGHGAMIRRHCLADAVAAEVAEARANCTLGAAAGGGGSGPCGDVGSDGRVEPNARANNNAAYEKLFVVDVSVPDRSSSGGGGGGGGGAAGGAADAVVVLREVAGDCPVIMDAPSRAESMRSPMRGDLASCTLPFDVRPFLALGGDALGGGARASDVEGRPATACEAAADAPGAFPVMHLVSDVQSTFEFQ